MLKNIIIITSSTINKYSTITVVWSCTIFKKQTFCDYLSKIKTIKKNDPDMQILARDVGSRG